LLRIPELYPIFRKKLSDFSGKLKSDAEYRLLNFDSIL
jgi:hypothetical protein